MLARAKGLNMWIEYYPYDAASTAIGSEQLAPESLEGPLGYKYKDVMCDPIDDGLEPAEAPEQFIAIDRELHETTPLSSCLRSLTKE